MRTQIPLRLTVVHSLPTINGYLSTTSPTIALSGVANAIETRRVTVNGSDATWTAWTASWTHTGAPLLPGINYVIIRALDAAGKEIDRQTLEVWYDRGGETTVGASTISVNTLWTPGGGAVPVDRQRHGWKRGDADDSAGDYGVSQQRI